ncbi:MAG: OmpH family outer membrane protein [Ignavibacteriales bacterium]|nr:OmpH family outer membrane protein [Ignavibacteriales bacterium]
MAIILVMIVSTSSVSFGQSKIGWINSKTVMEKLPEAQDAQRQLDNLVADWQNELAKMQNDWQKKYQEYEKKKLILTDQLRVDAEKELQDLDKKISDYRNKKFGQNGELFNKQNEIMKPIQNKIFKALQEIAQEDEYDYILDKSGDVLLMYSNDKYDLTVKVLDKLTSYEK